MTNNPSGVPVAITCRPINIKQRRRSWCDGFWYRSFMAYPLSYLSLQPVLHDWCNKGRGMCNPVSGMVHKRTLAANRKE